MLSATIVSSENAADGHLLSVLGSMGKQYIPSHISSKILGKVSVYQEKPLITTFLSGTLGLES